MNREPTAAGRSRLDRTEAYLEDALDADTPEEKNYAIRNALQLLGGAGEYNEVERPGTD